MIASYDYQQKPIPLVVVNPDTNKYQLTQQAISLLKSISGPIGVISVAGLYRTGKSYLLNRILLNKSKGFGVGNTVVACTKGLWCWGKPLVGTTSDGKSVNILVIDSEGIGATQQDANHDTKIFTLAVLASSCFIYNSMGSIDQNALQNLGLVVNLTKHIQLQSQNHGQQDPQRIANYFPSFCWVVRDFSLQLVDQQNNPITQKQYLQNALMPHKGSSEDIQQKNRIRKLLTTFFKQRECFTFVRPEVDEEKLQNLDKIDLKELRPQFVDQVLSFRNKVISKIKVKTMNDQILDGDMYCNMLSSYVQAINDGAVPNIQSAWNYMCMEKCEAVKNQCFNFFVNETKAMRFPIFQEKFENQIQKLREQTLSKFRKASMGDISEKYEKDIYNMIKEQIKKLREQNSMQASKVLQIAVNQVFQPIAKKVKKGQYESYEMFQQECRKGYAQLLDRGMDFPNSKLKYLQLYRKVQKQGAQFLIKNLDNKMKRLEQLFTTKQIEYQNQIANYQQQSQKDRICNKQKINILDRQNFQAKNKIQKLEYELNRINKQRKSQEQNLKGNLSNKKIQLQNMKKDMIKQTRQVQQKYQQLQKNLFVQQKQWQKQKSVMKATIDNNLSIIQQLKIDLQLRNVQSERTKSQEIMVYKENINKLQLKKIQLEAKNKDFKEKNQQFQEKIRQLNDQLQETTEKLQKKQRKTKEELTLKSKEIQRLKQQANSKIKEMDEQSKELRQKLFKQTKNLQDGNTKQKQYISQLKQKMSKMQHMYQEKINNQSFDLQMNIKKVNQLQSLLATSRLQFETKINKLKDQMGKQSVQKQKTKIVEIERETIIKITQIQSKYESQKRNYISQIDSYKSKYTQFQQQLKENQRRFVAQRQEFQRIQNQKNSKIKKLQTSLKEIENRNNQAWIEKQNFMSLRIKELEERIQASTTKFDSQRRSVHQHFQHQIREMKNRYQIQIVRLSTSLNNQRERLTKKMAQQAEERKREFDNKLEQIELQNQEIIKNLNDQLNELRIKYQKIQKCFQVKEIDYNRLQKDFYELKETSKYRQFELSTKLEQLNGHFKTQKATLQMRILQLQTKTNQMQKQILNKSNDCSLLSIQLQRFKSSLIQLEGQYESHKKDCSKRIQDLKSEYKNLQTQFMTYKLEYEKKNALLKQSLEFKETKCTQLESQLSSSLIQWTQKIKRIKTQAEETIQSMTSKILAQNQSLQKKYEALKKSSRQKELNTSKQVTNLNTEVAVLQQKLVNIQKAFSNCQIKAKNQISVYEKEIQSLKQSSKLQKEILIEQTNRLKQTIHQLQSKNKQIQRKMDRQVSSISYKCSALQESKKVQKQQSQQKLKKLQQEVQNLKNISSNCKSEIQIKSTQILIRTQNSYKSQIKEITQNYKKTITENDFKIRENQEQIKKLREELYSQKRKRQSSQKDYQQKFNQWQDYERKYSTEIDKLKRQRQMKALESQRLLERQKEILKEKLSESQNKFRKLEMDKTAQLFQFEKYKTQYRTQKGIMEQSISELKETIQKLERDKTIMASDVNKLKEEKKRSSSYIKFDRSQNQQRKSTITVNGRKFEGKSAIKKQEYENSSNKQNFTMNESLFLAD